MIDWRISPATALGLTYSAAIRRTLARLGPQGTRRDEVLGEARIHGLAFTGS